MVDFPSTPPINVRLDISNPGDVPPTKGAEDKKVVVLLSGDSDNVHIQLGDRKSGMVSITLTAPRVGGDSGEVTSTRDTLAKLDEQTVGLDIYSVMALFQQLAQTQRNTARELRQATMEQQVTSLQNSASEIRKAAEQRMVGAIVSGALQIAGGVAQIGSGIASGIQAGKAASKELQADKLGVESQQLKGDALAAQEKSMVLKQASGKTPESEAFKLESKELKLKSEGIDQQIGSLQKQAGQLSNQAERTRMTGQAVSGVLGGIGGIVSASQERMAAEHDAKKSEAETQAKIADTHMQQANDFMQQMMDLIRDVRDKLGSIEQSNVEANRGIARNI